MPHLTRRQYTGAFRQEAVRLLTEQGYGVTEAARNCGITTKMWGRWKRQIAHQRHGAARGPGPLSAAHDELVRWRQAVKRRRLERAMLKQAALFFAHEARCETPSERSISSAGRSRGGVRCSAWGAAGCMTPTSVRQPPRAGTKRATGLRVAPR
jgi:transposase